MAEPVLLLEGRKCARTNFESEGFRLQSGKAIHVQQKDNVEENTGFIVWDAAVELVRYLEAHEQRLKDSCCFENASSSIGKGEVENEIIELGSGVGLVGIAAAQIFGRTVLTDVEGVLEQLQLNIELNSSDLQGRLTAQVLDWSEFNAENAEEKFGRKKVKLILASDCLWLRSQVGDFVSALHCLALTSGSEGALKIIISQQKRSNQLEDDLSRELERRGFYDCAEVKPVTSRENIYIRELAFEQKKGWLDLPVRASSAETREIIMRLLSSSGVLHKETKSQKDKQPNEEVEKNSEEATHGSGDLQVKVLRSHLWAGARISCLDEEELYFLTREQGEGKSVISLRNEYASAAKICDLNKERDIAMTPSEIDTKLSSSLLVQDPKPKEGASAAATAPGTATAFESGTPESDIVTWAERNGIESNLIPASVSYGNLSRRGAISTKRLGPGETVLKIPEGCLLGIEKALKSEIGELISQIKSQAGEDFALLLWSLWDRQNEKSEFAAVWRSLPSHFNTGLSLDRDSEELTSIQNLPLGMEILSAQDHLSAQYESYFKPLMGVLTEYLGESGYEWEDYLWASELWYAYAVHLANEESETSCCLVPLLFFCNHSLHPHAVHYSRIKDGVLRMNCCRSIEEGEEVFISYGPLPTNKLITFYGFAIPKNPYDVFEIQIDPADLGLTENKKMQEVLQLYKVGMEHKLSKGRVSPKLMASLKIMMANRKELEKAVAIHSFESKMGWDLDLGRNNQRKACEVLQSVVSTLLGQIPKKRNIGKSSQSNASIYLDSVRDILQSTMDSCATRG